MKIKQQLLIHSRLRYISFDYAQQLLYPYNPQQPGPAYFKSARKCQLFGICCEGNNTQMEKEPMLQLVMCIIISSIMARVKIFLEVHCDNCVGQNKNNTTILYFGWRVLTGLNSLCSVSFMIPGHTKFGPDWLFGLIKQKYQKTRVSSMHQIESVVKDSTVNGQKKSFIVGQNMSKFNYYSWNDFLAQFFTTTPNITSYHHFLFKAQNPGVVTLKKCSDSPPTTFQFLKSPVVMGQLPSIIQPDGLSDSRQQYLYEKICQFCEDEYKDITCPQPKSRKRAPVDNSAVNPPSKRLAATAQSLSNNREHSISLYKDTAQISHCSVSY